jgi:ferredoxin
MKLACEDFGEVGMWRCPYHGFTYASTGEFMGTLIGAPYPEGLDRDALHLIEARVDSYQGLLFATWARDTPSLGDFLGDVRWYLDIFAGRAEMEVVGVPQKWVVPSAGKLPSEHFAADAYHTATAHSFLARLGMVKGVDFGRDGYHVDPGNGHGLGTGHEEPRGVPLMRLTVDLSRCQGYGNCVSAAPELFDLDDSGMAVVLIEEPDEGRLAAAQNAVRVCPVAAIAVTG